jgi:AAHS family 4-hydroxybenzoate transporter-like MFS transporter
MERTLADGPPAQLSLKMILALLTILAILVVDGLDLQMLAFAAPSMLGEWGVTKAQFGLALAAAPLGMAFGTLLGGTLGDRLGRRVVLLWSCAAFCLLTLVVPLSQNLLLLAVIRFFSGIGFGAVAPNAFMLAMEISPKTMAPRIAGLMAIGTALGGVLGGSLALVVINHAGWQACFYVSSAITGAIFLAALRLLPESPVWLATHRGAEAEPRPGATRHAAPGGTSVPDLMAKLFAPSETRKNLGVVLSFFSYAFVSYAFLTWMPTVLQAAGFPSTAAIQSGIAYNACAIAASLAAGWIIERTGTRASVFGAVVVAFVALLVMLYVLAQHLTGPSGILLILLSSALVGLSTGLTVPAVYLIVSVSYEVQVRSTAAGLGGTAARVGGILVSLAGGAVLGAGSEGGALFVAVLLGMVVLLAASNLVIQVHVPRRT